MTWKDAEIEKFPDQSGFYPINNWNICNDINHMPPSHIVVPYSMFYLHVCPSCKQKQRIFSNEVFCKTGYSTS